MLVALNGIDFGLKEAQDIDILGDAYEYMIGQFAAGAGKKAGEFYTPQEVSQILAEIVITGKQRLKTVFDPTCGSGSLLLRTARSGKADEIFGQEKNPTTFNLCRFPPIGALPTNSTTTTVSTRPEFSHPNRKPITPLSCT